MNKIYAVRYSANECDDVQHFEPLPIYLSEDKQKVIDFFNAEKQKEKDILNDILENNPELEDNEDYAVYEDTDTKFEICIGNWYSEYNIVEWNLEEDLRYGSH